MSKSDREPPIHHSGSSTGYLIVHQLGRALGSNALALSVSLTVTLLLPKLIGITDYSYWQLYVFYLGYVGVLQFGWSDGVYLRAGGARYSDLDKPLLFSQFWSLTVSQMLLALAGAVVVVLGVAPEPSRLLIGIAVSAAIPILASRQFCSLLLQATGRIAEYARITAAEPAVFLVLAAFAWLAGYRDFRIFVACDLMAKASSMSMGLYACRDAVIGPHVFRPSFSETKANIGAGISLMVANVSGILCIGVVRFGVERRWSIIEFGVLSLGLSATNLMLIFFNSVGLVAFPALRRASSGSRTAIYLAIRSVLVPSAFVLMLLYVPIRWVLIRWLPNYEQSFAYMAILLPMIVFEGKNALLTNPYLKTLRGERFILVSNASCLLLSAFLTATAIVGLHRLELAAWTILLVTSVRGLMSEFILGRLLGVQLFRSQVGEVCLALLFSGAFWFLGQTQAISMYVLGVSLMLALRRRTFADAVKSIKGQFEKGAE